MAGKCYPYSPPILPPSRRPSTQAETNPSRLLRRRSYVIPPSPLRQRRQIYGEPWRSEKLNRPLLTEPNRAVRPVLLQHVRCGPPEPRGSLRSSHPRLPACLPISQLKWRNGQMHTMHITDDELAARPLHAHLRDELGPGCCGDHREADGSSYVPSHRRTELGMNGDTD